MSAIDRKATEPACLYAAGVTVVFVIIVNLIGLRRVHTLNLTDVNANQSHLRQKNPDAMHRGFCIF